MTKCIAERQNGLSQRSRDYDLILYRLLVFCKKKLVLCLVMRKNIWIYFRWNGYRTNILYTERSFVQIRLTFLHFICTIFFTARTCKPEERNGNKIALTCMWRPYSTNNRSYSKEYLRQLKLVDKMLPFRLHSCNAIILFQSNLFFFLLLLLLLLFYFTTYLI